MSEQPHGSQADEKKEPPLKPDFLDAVALFLAAIQILAPAVLVIIGAMLLGYLLLYLLAR